MRVPILLYHWFDDGRPSASPEFGISPAVFRQQMEWLADEGIRVLSLAELTAAVQGRAPLPSGRCTCITFDDGYSDFIDHAAPILDELGFPSTIFAVSGRTGETNSWDAKRGEPARELLSWDGLRQLADAGVEIGSHSVSHPDLRSLDDATLERELVDSRARLEDGLGRAVPHLAYPHGLHDDRVKDAARAAGYDAACAVLLRPWDLLRSDDFALMRVIIHGTKSPASFRRRVRLAAPNHRKT